MMQRDYLTLSQLTAEVRAAVRHQFPEEVWLLAETSDVRCANNGHCYLEFVEKEERNHTAIARARGMIWSNTYRQLRPYFEQETGQAFTSGIKVLVKVRIEFNEVYGFGLVVTAIDPTYTVGDLVRRRREILLRLQQDGILTMNKELSLPVLPQRVAVVSSATAAGYGDFCDQLHKNPHGYAFTTRLFPAIMQGERVEASIIAALDAIFADADRWDVVVIIRGGGATSDLAGFDTYALAASVAQFPLPIITGIGHERDDTVLDLIAHTRVKTPTAAAEFLIAQMDLAEERLLTAIDKLVTLPRQRLDNEKLRMSRLAKRIPQAVTLTLNRREKRLLTLHEMLRSRWSAKVQQATYRLDLLPRFRNSLLRRLDKEKAKMELLTHRIQTLSPEQWFKRGYTLTLKNGKAVRSIHDVAPGDRLETITADGRIHSEVK